MDLTVIQKSIDQLKETIIKQIHHKTLVKYTGLPMINENQLFFLLLPYLNGDYWNEQMDEEVVTIGIIFASVFEHEKIDEVDATSKVQQLTVLAGDYYSGRYYEILANSGNIRFIQELSSVIYKICEEQIKVYEPIVSSLQQWMDTLSIIDSKLIEKFYSMYHFNHYKPLLQTTLLIQRLQKELYHYQLGNPSTFMNKMLESITKESSELSLEQVLSQKIDLLIEQLQNYVSSSNLKDELKEYIMQQVTRSEERL